jgi:hypothetical protein
MGLTLYFCHNPKAADFQKYLTHFFKNTKEYLLLYYTGHGGTVKDTSGDEADGQDEALVFDDGFVVDDKLQEILKSSGKPATSKIVLLNDCCHSGSIWDLQSGKGLPANVMCLSAAKDSQTAKQTSIGGADQGIFTFHFFQLLEDNPKFTPNQIEPKINAEISKYQQMFTKSATTPALLTQPILP